MSVFSWGGRDWTLEETPEGPRVIIPSPRLWPVSVFMAVWLSGWVMGEVSAIKSLLGLLTGMEHWAGLFPAAFLVFWLAGWTAGGVFAWAIFLFSLDGRETVFVRGGKLCLRPETFLGLGWTWTYDIPGMTPPRVVGADLADAKPAGADDARARALAGLKLAYIAIESGGRKWRLGVGLGEQRARDLLYTLNSRFGLPRERRP